MKRKLAEKNTPTRNSVTIHSVGLKDGQFIVELSDGKTLDFVQSISLEKTVGDMGTLSMRVLIPNP
jgi:hypothetical protein